MNKLLRVARNPIRFANYFFIRFLNKKIDKLSSIKKFFSGKKGLEIGGPSQIFKTSGYVPIYPMADTIDGVNFSSTTVWENTISEGETYDFSSSKKGYQFIQDGTDLNMIPSETYDFLLSSHSLEHIANPIKAIKEWLRIIKKGGVLLIIVPDQRYTFDCKRPVTKFEHLIQDYENETSENDLTHLEEIVSLHDLAYDSGINSIEKFKKRSENNFVNRCLHHHVFSLDLLEDIFKHFNLKMVLRTEAPPYHLIALGMKKD